MSRGLGKGLDALLKTDVPLENITEEKVSGQLVSIPLTQITPNEKQARKVFSKEEIDQLAQSIQEHGVIQPVLLATKQNGKYPLIAGERRYRAAKQLGLNDLPAIIKDVTAEELLEISLIENLQRVNLNPIEEAQGIQYLMDQCNLTQEQAAEKLGKNRSTVANVLRLLALPSSIRQLVLEDQLSRGHAKCLLSVTDQEQQHYLARLVVEQKLSVRELEKLIKEKPKAKSVAQPTDSELADFQNRLTEKLKTKVNITGSVNQGKIQITYYSLDDLNKLYDLLLQ